MPGTGMKKWNHDKGTGSRLDTSGALFTGGTILISGVNDKIVMEVEASIAVLLKAVFH